MGGQRPLQHHGGSAERRGRGPGGEEGRAAVRHKAQEGTDPFQEVEKPGRLGEPTAAAQRHPPLPLGALCGEEDPVRPGDGREPVGLGRNTGKAVIGRREIWDSGSVWGRVQAGRRKAAERGARGSFVAKRGGNPRGVARHSQVGGELQGQADLAPERLHRSSGSHQEDGQPVATIELPGGRDLPHAGTPQNPASGRAALAGGGQ